MKFFFLAILVFAAGYNLYAQSSGKPAYAGIDSIRLGFSKPPPAARPGVYWFFMDGNRTKAAMTADMESMKRAGIVNLVFLEVNVGVPRGPVDFLSDEWKELRKSPGPRGTPT